MDGDHQASQDQGLFRKDKREVKGVIGPDHPGHAPQGKGKAKRHHDQGEGSFSNEWPKHHPVQKDAEKKHEDERKSKRGEERKLQEGNEGIGDKSPDHHEFALGKVDDLSGFVDEDETQGNEGIDTPHSHSTDDLLPEHLHGLPESSLELDENGPVRK